mmetsp:Transcript_59036/g.103793  ORF Transcript_59036/g.103793 Transcript_59036/m.103793 type:complete len:247 (-) Transcript_59036:110-850(-)
MQTLYQHLALCRRVLYDQNLRTAAGEFLPFTQLVCDVVTDRMQSMWVRVLGGALPLGADSIGSVGARRDHAVARSVVRLLRRAVSPLAVGALTVWRLHLPRHVAPRAVNRVFNTRTGPAFDVKHVHFALARLVLLNDPQLGGKKVRFVHDLGPAVHTHVFHIILVVAASAVVVIVPLSFFLFVGLQNLLHHHLQLRYRKLVTVCVRFMRFVQPIRCHNSFAFNRDGAAFTDNVLARLLENVRDGGR